MSNYYCNSSSIGTSSVAGNFTYADASSEGSMVTASVLMFVLAGFFFILNLFGGLSNVGAILSPRVRLLFTSLLSLFLLVMSYLLSEAKNTAKELDQVTTVNGIGRASSTDLPFMAGVILTWMLLVELIRKKVDEIAMKGYSGTIHRAGRVVWLGSLVFVNIRSAGRKAVFGVLWVLCATKVVQRIAFTEVGKRSYACGKNPWIITSYMMSTSPSLPAQGDAMLKGCRYIVTGEEDARVEATADGYKLKEDSKSSLVTVGKIWVEQGLPGTGNNGGDEKAELKRLCLSFALSKLLRRRLEQLPVPEPEMSSAETSECRDVIFNGLYKSGDAVAVFEVMNSEINFLSEYYHSVVPVVLASPFFFVANYFLLPVVVLCVCVMTIILCGGGDVLYAFRSIKTDNFTISSGIFDTTMCLLLTAHHSAAAFFATINFAVTFLLYIIYIYEEVWELFVFLLSNWFAVSLLSAYVAKTRFCDNSAFRAFARCILSVRTWLGFHLHPQDMINQFSALDLRWPPLTLAMPIPLITLLVSTKPVPVPVPVKHSILLSSLASASASASTKSALASFDELKTACENGSIAEVILICHIATGLLERLNPPPDPKVMITESDSKRMSCCGCPNKKKKNTSSDNFTVATTLSRYCAYLVAFQPELLPDYHEKAEDLFKAMKMELKDRLGCYHYYFSCGRERADAIINNINSKNNNKEGTVDKGAELANKLLEKYTNDHDSMWTLLAEVWTEIIVYVAPSNEERTIMAHKNVLWQGGEFITVLWALMTHTGITRHRRLREIALKISQDDASTSSSQQKSAPDRIDKQHEIDIHRH
ncbi:hypothetical protein EE612_031604 [Oryza sativa]|nr:hypothetical protein EE612_031604 [Oryza sativa]